MHCVSLLPGFLHTAAAPPSAPASKLYPHSYQRAAHLHAHLYGYGLAYQYGNADPHPYRDQDQTARAAHGDVHAGHPAELLLVQLLFTDGSLLPEELMASMRKASKRIAFILLLLSLVGLLLLRRRGRPPRRGWSFYGGYGDGYSSLAKALLQDKAGNIPWYITSTGEYWPTTAP